MIETSKNKHKRSQTPSGIFTELMRMFRTGGDNVPLAERYRGCLMGLACGDAIGSVVQHQARGSFNMTPDMTGGGPLVLEPGAWTANTSVALCLAESLVAVAGFKADDQMERYIRWYGSGHLTSHGQAIDAGRTLRYAFRRFLKTGSPNSGPTDPRTAGNGAISRIGPMPMYYYSNVRAAIYYSGECSKTTHGCSECVHGARLLGAIIHKILDGKHKDEVLFGEHFPDGVSKSLTPGLKLVAEGAYKLKPRSAIRGDRYIVNSIEAALWCFYRTETFKDAVLEAASLGEDADVTASVCGQIAGAYYGLAGIPEEWQSKLARRDLITRMSDQLFAASMSKNLASYKN